MFSVSDIPDQVLRDIAGAYHRRLASTDAESQPSSMRDFQRTVYLRTALEWLYMWLNKQPTHAAAPDLLAALEEVVRISDRKHDAWDAAKAAIKKARGES